jgi:ribose transport system ATP-binding protein
MNMEPSATEERRGEPLLRIENLEKRFGSTLALADVNLNLHEGDSLALLGENGAGKSTLIKIAAGVHTADHGSMLYRGRPLDLSSGTRDISFVHQDLGLVDSMSVAENVALGSKFGRRTLQTFSWQRIRREARSALERLDLDIDVDATVEALSPAERSLVAIARGLTRDAQVLVLDEPTATLGPHEAAALFRSLVRLREQGIGIIYVTHRLDEVSKVTNKVVVLRNGRVELTGDTADFNTSQLSAAIAGREISMHRGVEHLDAVGEPVISLRAVVTEDAGPLTLDIKAGEVTALTGLVGAGQHDVSGLLCGDVHVYDGDVSLGGRRLRRLSAHSLVASGFAFTPTDRANAGIAPGLVVRENLFGRRKRPRNPLRPFSVRQEMRQAASIVEKRDIRPTDPEYKIVDLSGGNQQKMVVARALEGSPRVVVLEDPTIGVDIGTKAAIYSSLREAARQGVAVVVVTTDLEEVALVADRVLVFRHGQIAGELIGSDVTEERVMTMTLGVSQEGGVA